MRIRILYIAVLVLSSYNTFAQCEGLEGDNKILKNWRYEYMSYFHTDKMFPLIKADSILIYYLSDSVNENTLGITKSYKCAATFAESELNDNVKLLFKQLKKPDSVAFASVQSAWEKYCRLERAFLYQAFNAEPGSVKCGTVSMTQSENASRYYKMIKSRILTIKEYIEESMLFRR